MRRFLALLFLGTALAHAQHPAGSITGHIFAADTNLPIRNARVTLEPVPSLAATVTDKDRSRQLQAEHKVLETQPDGSFTFNGIAPGAYYVLAQKKGYVSLLTTFTPAELEHPTQASLAHLAEVLPTVLVTSGHTSDTRVALHPGAVLAGTIRFDDGSPDSGARVEALSRGADGKWTDTRSRAFDAYMGEIATDDQGHFRISGLPAGDYILRTWLEIQQTTVSKLYDESSNTMTEPLYSLPLLSGGGFRPADATPITLHAGEDSETNDITIPLARLHTLSGSLAEPRTGHHANAATVTLAYPDDGTTLMTTDLDPEDDTFHFGFVPDGTWTLKATNVQDVTRTEVPQPPGYMPATRTVTKKLRIYADSTQPIVIKSDTTGITLPIEATTSNAP